MSGHRRKTTEKEALTPWRRQREELVRRWKGSDRERGAHSLEMWRRDELVRTRKENQLSGGTHELQTVERIHQDTEGSGQVKRTHKLETAEEEICQDREKGN